MGRFIAGTILFLVSYAILITVMSYFTYGDGSKTTEEITARKAEFTAVAKKCDQRAKYVRAHGYEFDYGACLANKGR